MSKILILLVVSCLAFTIMAKGSCLSKCPAGCFIDNNQNKCRACPAGCNNCTDPDTCTICAPGYFLNDDKNCVECAVSGCANCTERGVCTDCQSGYYLFNSSLCQFCGFLCDKCLSPTLCRSCRTDTMNAAVYYSKIGGGSCNYCPDGCKSCLNSGVCTECRIGYVLSEYQCMPCSTVDSACTVCNEDRKNCSACSTGHFLFNNTCLECSAGCSNCTDESSCQKCQEGYFLNSNNGCTPCMKGCKTCTSAGVCDDCHEGYEYLEKEAKCSICTLDCDGLSLPVAPPMPFNSPIAVAMP